MLRKGQIQLVFTFIILILVAGFLVILGYRFITGLQQDSCEAEKATFSTRVEGFFDRYDDYGSVHRESLRLPCDYRHICFVNNSVWRDGDEVNPAAEGFGSDSDEYNVIKTAEDVQNNIFIIGQFAEPIGFSEKVEVDRDENILCLEEAGGRVDVVFRGQGRTTLVEED